MKTIFVQNLALMVTDKCNFNCRHCMRGTPTGLTISDDTIENTFNKIHIIGNVAFTGGEPLLAVDRMRQALSTMKRKKIIFDQFGFISNGTLYDEQLIKELFDEYEEYSKQFAAGFGNSELSENNTHGYIHLSWDEYHQEQLTLLRQQNLNLYKEYVERIELLTHSKYFRGIAGLNGPLFDEGHAKNLDVKKTPLKAIKKYFTEADGITYLGPIIGILPDGIITECDGSDDSLRTQYNYGNINQDNIPDIIHRIAGKCKTLKQFDKKCKRSMDNFANAK